MSRNFIRKALKEISKKQKMLFQGASASDWKPTKALVFEIHSGASA